MAAVPSGIIVKCVFCGDDLENGEETIRISEKGFVEINQASIASGTPLIKVSAGQQLHVKCRLTHIDKRRIKVSLKRKSTGAGDASEIPTLRSKEPSFIFKDHCFLYGTQIDNLKEDDVYSVRTWDYQWSITRSCDERPTGDTWAEAVRGRIIFTTDLPAVDAIYHQVCSVNFRTGKQIPLRYQCERMETKIHRLGRPVDLLQEEAFLKVTGELIEVDDEQTTVSDLVTRISQISTHPYNVKYMRKQLMKSFEDKIANVNGRPDVTFRTTAAKILQTFHDAPKLGDEESRKRQIIRTAAQLIKLIFSQTRWKNSQLLYEKLPQLDVVNNFWPLDIMWKISWPLRPKRPRWSGTMQAVCQEEHPGKASVHFLPMIDLDPTDMSCIYSTVHCVATESQRHRTVPILTFDQPLWWKAKTILVNENQDSHLKSTVLNLGPFIPPQVPLDLVIEQTLMRALKTTGGLTRGRGMEETQKTRWLLAVPACTAVNNAMQELTGAQFHTKRTSRAYGSESSVHWGREVTVDPQLLFQRLLIVANSSDCDLEEVLKFELSVYPAALFDKNGLLRQANKPQLSEAIAALIPKESADGERGQHVSQIQERANTENKQNFIHFRSKRLEASNIETSKADGDADTLIAQTGVERVKLGVNHVIGEHTDILVLLCHYVQPGSAIPKSECPDNILRVECKADPCEVDKHLGCPLNPDAVCRPHYCGGCYAQYFRGDVRVYCWAF
ncbi:hypothetical protein ScPMuIL_002417 [Solemya velum]